MPLDEYVKLGAGGCPVAHLRPEPWLAAHRDNPPVWAPTAVGDRDHLLRGDVDTSDVAHYLARADELVIAAGHAPVETPAPMATASSGVFGLGPVRWIRLSMIAICVACVCLMVCR